MPSDEKSANERPIQFVLKWLKKANWWQVRSVGNLGVLKVSYLALFGIPFLLAHDTVLRWLGLDEELVYFSTLYFASLFLALANLVYDLCCPTIIKRFESQNDLYCKMLEIKALSVQSYPDDNFEASFDHCDKAYRNMCSSRKAGCLTCKWFFAASAVLFALLFIYRTFIVLASLVMTMFT